MIFGRKALKKGIDHAVDEAEKGIDSLAEALGLEVKDSFFKNKYLVGKISDQFLSFTSKDARKLKKDLKEQNKALRTRVHDIEEAIEEHDKNFLNIAGVLLDLGKQLGFEVVAVPEKESHIKVVFNDNGKKEKK